MADYCSVSNTFWTDAKIADKFTPDDKYTFLYLITCPLGNISGCYRISLSRMAFDMGLSQKDVENQVRRLMDVHQVIEYNDTNKEVLIRNWWKYHWSKSPKYLIALREKIACVKTERFKESLLQTLDQFLASHDINDFETRAKEQSSFRSDITPSTRMRVFDRDRFTCQYCGRSSPSVVLEIDHLYPVSFGGKNDISNLVTACTECNSGKSNRVLITNIGEKL